MRTVTLVMAGGVAGVVTLGALGGAGALRAASQPEAPGTVETGRASWYGQKHHGKRTASGELFDQDGFTAAHPSLPFGTRLKVTLLANGRSVEVRINDRFPRTRGRLIDLSRAAAREIGMMRRGTGRVRLEVLEPERTELAAQSVSR